MRFLRQSYGGKQHPVRRGSDMHFARPPGFRGNTLRTAGHKQLTALRRAVRTYARDAQSHPVCVRATSILGLKAARARDDDRAWSFLCRFPGQRLGAKMEIKVLVIGFNVMVHPQFGNGIVNLDKDIPESRQRRPGSREGAWTGQGSIPRKSPSEGHRQGQVSIGRERDPKGMGLPMATPDCPSLNPSTVLFCSVSDCAT